MNLVKTVVIASLLVMICTVPANAWGKKEQGFLLGAATALTLPHLLHSRPYYQSNAHIGRYYHDRDRHYTPNIVHAPTIVKVEQSRPQIIYVQTDDVSVPAHRKVKSHNYIHNNNPQRVIIEHANGAVTIVER
ncbi:MAG: hypothetical protein LBF71_06055 [Campylobacteraceae bacterium]|jgi:hypothetical protein|nr:hypothetical protein [Campylobacteraceae bacterium]